MRTEVWYPLGGLLLLASLVQLTVGVVRLPAAVHSWATWGGGAIAAGLSLAAGFYATQNTWIEKLAVWVLGLHPVVLLLIGLAFVSAVWKTALALVPDQWVGLALTSTMVWTAFALPILAKHAIPPGDVANLARTAVDQVGGFAVAQTRTWFA